MRNNEWRVIDEPESPRDKDLPEDWMAIFDEELADGWDVGNETVAQGAEDNAVPRSSGAVAESTSAVDNGVPMEDVRPDTSTSIPHQLPDQSRDDVQLIRPAFAPSNIHAPTKTGDLDHGHHPPTDTPRLHPIPSSGLPLPSPITTTSNTPTGYFTTAIDTATAAESVISAEPAPVETSEPHSSPRPPQDLTDTEPTHVYEDDTVTVYTDDVQIVPDSVAESSPLPSDRVATSVVLEDKEESEVEGTSEHVGLGFTETIATEAQIEGSGSELEEDSESEQSEGPESIDSRSSGQGDYRTRTERLTERLDQGPGDKSDGLSAAGSDHEEVDTERKRVPKQESPQLVESQTPSPRESKDVSEEHDDFGAYDEGDGMSNYDEDASDQGSYEEDYEDDEQEGRRRDEYGYSESEVESEYEEQPPAQFPPKNAEPEIIVLDSDSEDDVAAPRAVEPTNREAEGHSDEGSDEGSDGSEYQKQLEEEIYNEEDPYSDGIEEDQDEYAYGRGAEDAVSEDLESGIEDGKDDQHTMDERFEHGWRPEPERVDEHLAEHKSEETQEHLDIPAEPSLYPEQSSASNEFVQSHEYLEDFQPAPDYSHGSNHDSLDYLATVSESAERVHATAEPAHSGYDMAIDPSLYESREPQYNKAVNAEAQAYSREHPADSNTETREESPQSTHERHMAFRLDGAAPPEIATTSTEETVPMPIRQDSGQLMTPGPSQPVEADQPGAGPTGTLGQMLPTPDLTQEALTTLETEQPHTAEGAKESFDVSENRRDSPIMAVKSENVPNTIKIEQNESTPPEIVSDVAIPASPDQEQKLQASIEVDEQFEDSIRGADDVSVDRHYPGLRSKLSYFAPLATLIDHYNALVDTISVAAEAGPPVKAATGKRDFILNLQLTDRSMAGTTVFAQILRPYKSALPSLQEGHAILLRNFRVKTLDHSVILVSDSTSAWAVFSGSSEDAEMTGPPVEYGAEEKEFATDLRQWYLEDGLAMVADNQLQASVGRESDIETPASSAAQSDAESIDLALREGRDTSSSRGSRRRKSHRRITIHELRDGRRYTEVGSSPGNSSIHELRDGTVYANM